MKRLVDYLIFYIVGAVLFLCFINPFEANSQFLNKNATWVTGLIQNPPFEFEWTYYRSFIEKDTIINRRSYSIIQNWIGVYALREDSNKVYCKALKRHDGTEIETVERVLYDFNLNLTDTFQLYYINGDTILWVVKKVDSVIINNEAKKRIWLEEISDKSEKRESYCIEDIGSSFGLFWNIAITEISYTAELNCFMISKQPIYGECTSVGTELFGIEYNPIIFYNNINQIKIELPTKESCTLNIYTVMGYKVFSENIPCNQFINFDKPGQGIYIFEVVTNTERYCKKIFIK